jgi:ADP-dependent phosphofructokinase/glucokinase
VDAKTEWSIMDATGSVCKKGTGNKVLVNDLKVGVYFLHTEGYYIRIVKI